MQDKNISVSTKRKIAVIEDELPIQQMYKLRLELAGFDVQCAADGQAGLELIKAFHPQLILLDLRMPLMNGDEMLKKVQSTDLGANLKVIVLTNISRDEAPQSLRFLHVDRYIVKAHHTPHQVTAIVKEVLNTRT